MTKLYISADLNTGTSGGLVCSKELQAMKSLDKDKDDILIIDYKDIDPTYNKLPNTPFLIDYLTVNKLMKMNDAGLLNDLDLVHMYGGCYTQTIRYLKNLKNLKGKDITTTMTIMWHNRKSTIEEFEKYYGPYPYSHVKDDNLWNIYIDGVREIDVLIAPGAVPRQLMLDSGCKKVEIIPLGCDIPDVENVKAFPSDFRVGYLGAIGPDKGLFYLIKAWEKLNYKDSLLVFAGPYPDMLEKAIIKFVAKGTKSRFHLMGIVNEPRDLYNNVSIYCQPSATEGFGLEVIEAMSYGRPVICSDGAGAVDCITDIEDGFVVPKKDINSIAKKIDWFKNNPGEIERMGKNARKNVEKFTWDKTIEKYASLWESLI